MSHGPYRDENGPTKSQRSTIETPHTQNPTTMEPSHDQLMFLIHRVFLPPQLPEKNDFQLGYENVMINIMIDSLQALGESSATRRNCFAMLKTMFINARQVHDSLTGDILEDELLWALERIGGEGSITLPDFSRILD